MPHEINLLLSIYFEEENQEGLEALKRLLATADHVQPVVFAHGRKQPISANDVAVGMSKPFNLVEGVLKFRDGSDSFRRLDVRYRPAISSRAWAELKMSSDPASLMEAASRVHSREEAESFQFHFSLNSFENASRKSNTTNVAVFEALHYSIASTNTIEKTILQAFDGYYPEFLRRQIWGYADVVPFRELSISKEWEAASASILWPDLAVSRDALHQYMFTTPGAHPKVAVPAAGVREGNLTIYRLPVPPWAHAT